MGSGQSKSKSSPDMQMRMKMENGFDDGDDGIDEALGLSERKRGNRFKSNQTLQPTTDRLQTEEIKSAPVGSKKEKDAEVDAAIAELEETFKVLGDEPLLSTSVGPDVAQPASAVNERNNFMPPGDSESPSPTQGEIFEQGRDNHRDQAHTFIQSSDTGSSSSESERTSLSKTQYPSGDHTSDLNSGFPRRHSNVLDLNGGTCRSSGDTGATLSSSGSSYFAMNSRGSETRPLLPSNHSNFKRGRHHNTQSILIQQRKDFQRQHVDNGHSKSPNQFLKSNYLGRREEDWAFEPPKIDGFDVQKFKEVNSKETQTTVVPIYVRDEEDNGYYSRSPDIPSYTKAELDLLASIERDVY